MAIRGRPSVPLAQRLWARVEQGPGCWVWTGAVLHNGYGQIGLGGKGAKLVRVHRLAYELERGLIPDGMEVDHQCRNRRCCNPAHLEIVTREENIARGNAPHIVNARKTHCKRGHPLSGVNIKVRTRGNRVMRVCIQCATITNRSRPSRAKVGASPFALASTANVDGAHDMHPKPSEPRS